MRLCLLLAFLPGCYLPTGQCWTVEGGPIPRFEGELEIPGVSRRLAMTGVVSGTMGNHAALESVLRGGPHQWGSLVMSFGGGGPVPGFAITVTVPEHLIDTLPATVSYSDPRQVRPPSRGTALSRLDGEWLAFDFDTRSADGLNAVRGRISFFRGPDSRVCASS